MGVHNLWQLLGPVGRRISLETLEGKILAVDVSIWLVQFIKAMRDDEGKLLPNAHLIGTFRRIVKLLFHRIKPVFVFDGGVPVVKKRTVERRRQRRHKQEVNMRKQAEKILLSQLKQSLAKQSKIEAQASSSPPLFTLSRQDRERENDGTVSVVVDDSNDAKEQGEEEEEEEQWEDGDVRNVPSSESEGEYDTSGMVSKEVDEEALAAMPAGMRKGVIASVHRDFRKSSRDSYLKVAGNMDDYSSTQLTNFLKISTFNQKVLRVSKKDSANQDSRSIASEANKRFVFKRGGSAGGEETQGGKKGTLEAMEAWLESQQASTDKQPPSDPCQPIDIADPGSSSASESVSASQPKRRRRLRRIVDGPIEDEPTITSERTTKSATDTQTMKLYLSSSSEEEVSAKPPQEAARQKSETHARMDSNANDDGLTETTEPRSSQGEASPGQADEQQEGGFDMAGGFEIEDEEDHSQHPQSPPSFSSLGANDIGFGEELDFQPGPSSSIQSPTLRQLIPLDQQDGSTTGNSEDGIIAIGDSDAVALNHAISESLKHKPMPTDQLDRVLHPWGFREESVSGDNDCMFTSIALQLERLPHSPATILSAADRATAMRHAIADWVEMNHERVIDHHDTTTQTSLACSGPTLVTTAPPPTVVRSGNVSRLSDFIEGSLQDYLTGLRKTRGAWGDHCALIAAASLFNLHIHIFSASQAIGEAPLVIAPLRGHTAATGEVQSIYLGHYPELHYVSTLPLSMTLPLTSPLPREVNNNNSSKEEEEGMGKPFLVVQPVSLDLSTETPSAFNVDDYLSPVNDPASQDGMGEGSMDWVDGMGEEVDEAGMSAVSAADSHDYQQQQQHQQQQHQQQQQQQQQRQQDEEEDQRRRAFEGAISAAEGLTDWASRAVKRAISRHQTSGNHAVTLESSSEDKVAEPESEEIPPTTEKRQDHSPGEAVIDDGSMLSVQSSLVSDRSSAQPLDLDELRESQRRAARDAESITDEMREEVMQLLTLFGLPYIVAPMEAESQCAVLEALGLCDGVVTDDSDAFLFGAEKVYKNMFNDKKYVEVYTASDAERELGIRRGDFISCAMLLGSDYTDGVKGVGIVNTMEVIGAFPTRLYDDGPFEALEKFKEWLDEFDPIAEASKKPIRDDDDDEFDPSDHAAVLQRFKDRHLRAKRRWTVPENFPDRAAISAYLDPMVNKSREEFEWEPPDIERIRNFCGQMMGWTSEETDRTLLPVIERLRAKTTQTRIDSYIMTYTQNHKFARIQSSRLQKAVSATTEKKLEESGASLSKPAKKKPVKDQVQTRKRTAPASPKDSKRSKKATKKASEEAFISDDDGTDSYQEYDDDNDDDFEE